MVLLADIGKCRGHPNVHDSSDDVQGSSHTVFSKRGTVNAKPQVTKAIGTKLRCHAGSPTRQLSN